MIPKGHWEGRDPEWRAGPLPWSGAAGGAAGWAHERCPCSPAPGESDGGKQAPGFPGPGPEFGTMNKSHQPLRTAFSLWWFSR